MFGFAIGAWIAVAAAIPPALNDQTFSRWRDHIHPKPAEVGWEEVPWRATLWDAVAEARKREKPVLLCAMNGHPLACT